MPYYSSGFFLSKINTFGFSCYGFQARYEGIDPEAKSDIGFDVVFNQKATRWYQVGMAKSDEICEQAYWRKHRLW